MGYIIASCGWCRGSYAESGFAIGQDYNLFADKDYNIAVDKKIRQP